MCQAQETACAKAWGQERCVWKLVEYGELDEGGGQQVVGASILPCSHGEAHRLSQLLREISLERGK